MSGPAQLSLLFFRRLELSKTQQFNLQFESETKFIIETEPVSLV